MSVEAQQRLSALREGMQRTRRLLDQLLALARAQESSPEIAPPVSMHKVFRQVIERLLPNAEAKSIDLGVCSASDAQLAVAEVDLMTPDRQPGGQCDQIHAEWRPGRPRGRHP